MSTPQLTPSSLFETQATMDSLRLQVYNRLLAAVHKKIRYVSTQPGGGSQMTHYDVPEWYPGCPLYDVKDCILYMVWSLRSAGFQVKYMSPNRLLMSWKEHATRYYQEESPIRQAMIAAANQGSRPAATATATGPKSKKTTGSYTPFSETVVSQMAGSVANTTGARRPGVGVGGGGGTGSSTITFI